MRKKFTFYKLPKAIPDGASIFEVNAPSNLSASLTDTTEITLDWDVPEGNVDSYKVYRDGTHIDTVSSIGYVDSGLTGITQYCYEVSSVYLGKESSKSNEACETTGQVYPSNEFIAYERGGLEVMKVETNPINIITTVTITNGWNNAPNIVDTDDEGNFIIGTNDARVLMYDYNLNLLWEAPIPADNANTENIICGFKYNGNIVAIRKGFSFVVLDKNDGSILYGPKNVATMGIYGFRANGASRGFLTTKNDNIYYVNRNGGDNNNMYLTQVNGDLSGGNRWKLVGSDTSEGGICGDDEGYLYGCGKSVGVIKTDRSGNVQWSTDLQLGGSDNTSEDIEFYNGYIYVVTYDGNIFVLDKDGNQVDSYSDTGTFLNISISRSGEIYTGKEGSRTISEFSPYPNFGKVTNHIEADYTAVKGGHYIPWQE